MRKTIFAFSLLATLLIMFSSAESKAAPPGDVYTIELSVEKAVIITPVEIVAHFDFAFNRFIVESIQELALKNEAYIPNVPEFYLYSKNQDELIKNQLLTNVLLRACNKLPDKYRNYGLSSGGMFN